MKLSLLSLFLCLGLATVLNLVEPVTRRCRKILMELEAQTRTVPEIGGRQEPAALDEVPETSRPRFYLTKVLTKEALLGFLFLLLFILFLPLNSRILAESFEVLLDRPGNPIGEMRVMGVDLQITDFHIYGFALSLAILVLAAGYGALEESRNRLGYILLAGLVGLIAFEVALSGWRGHLLASRDPGLDPLGMALGGSLQAFCSAIAEAVGGYWGIELFLIPLVQMILWSIIAPFRTIHRALMGRPRKQPSTLNITIPRPSLFVRVAAYIDEAIFGPLRVLDNVAKRWLRQRSIVKRILDA
jgi:hypothetical protein